MSNFDAACSAPYAVCGKGINWYPNLAALRRRLLSRCLRWRCSSAELGTKLGNGLKSTIPLPAYFHHHDGYEHTFRHTRFAAPPMPLVYCPFNALKAGRWLGMTGFLLVSTCRQ